MMPDLPLRDIHLPEAVGYWPPAPGWWLVAALLISAYFSWRFRQRRRLRRLALTRLEELARCSDPQLPAALSRLLRQAVISSFPKEYAGLSGEHWLEFLDRPFHDRPFTEGVGRCLLDAPYRPDPQVDSTALIALCRRWLKQLPPRPLRQERGQ